MWALFLTKASWIWWGKTINCLQLIDVDDDDSDDGDDSDITDAHTHELLLIDENKAHRIEIFFP